MGALGEEYGNHSAVQPVTFRWLLSEAAACLAFLIIGPPFEGSSFKRNAEARPRSTTMGRPS